jgi:hypothetical protein
MIKMRLGLKKYILGSKSVFFPQQPVFFFPQQPIFYKGLAIKFGQELTTLVHLQTGRFNSVNTLDISTVPTSCPTVFQGMLIND